MIRRVFIKKNKFFSAFLFLIYFISITSCKKSYRTEEIIYHNGDIHISAKIYVPSEEGKFPAVVIVPSAEPVTKEEYSEYAEYFAAHGIIAICYDKRGSGKTNGNIWKADFDDLLNDALAGISYLKNFDNVDTAHLGFLGHSQGGMYIFKSDRVSEDVDFVIDVSGSPLTPLSQSDYNIRSKILENGGDQMYADSLAGLMHRYIIYLRERENFQSIKNSYDHLITDPQKPVADKINYFSQFNYLNPPENIPSYDAMEMYPFMRSFDFEPGIYYPDLKTPALVVYGKNDHVIPSGKCIERVKELQKQSPNVDLKVYEKGNHAMKEESFKGQHYPDHYLEDLTEWIKSH